MIIDSSYHSRQSRFYMQVGNISLQAWKNYIGLVYRPKEQLTVISMGKRKYTALLDNNSLNYTSPYQPPFF